MFTRVDVHQNKRSNVNINGWLAGRVEITAVGMVV